MVSVSGFADVNELHMYYAVQGEGPPLVQLHGGTCTSDQLGVELFAERFRVIAPEQMGHGRTGDDMSRPFRYHDMAQDTVALLRYLKVKRASVLGFSDGGIVGLDLAIHHPELVSNLVVTGANFTTDGYTESGREFIMTAEPQDWPQEIREDYDRLSPDGPDHWPVVLERLRRMWLHEPNFTVEQLGRITAPTLVIVGDRDMIELEHSVALFRAIPDAQLCVVPGASHGAMPEQTILNFLREPKARAS